MDLVRCDMCHRKYRLHGDPGPNGSLFGFFCGHCKKMWFLLSTPMTERAAGMLLDLAERISRFKARAEIQILKTDVLLLILASPITIFTMGWRNGLLFWLAAALLPALSLCAGILTIGAIKGALGMLTTALRDRFGAQVAVVPRMVRVAISVSILAGLAAGAEDILADRATAGVDNWWTGHILGVFAWFSFPNGWCTRLLKATTLACFSMAYDVLSHPEVWSATTEKDERRAAREADEAEAREAQESHQKKLQEEIERVGRDKLATRVIAATEATPGEVAAHWTSFAFSVLLGVCAGFGIERGLNRVLTSSFSSSTSTPQRSATPRAVTGVSPVATIHDTPSARPARPLTGCITLTRAEIHLRQNSDMSYHGSARVPAGMRLQVMQRGSKTRGTSVAHRVLTEDGREGWMFLDPSRLDGPSCAEFRSGRSPVAHSQSSEIPAATTTNESNSAVDERFAGRSELRPSWEMRGVPSALDLAMTTSYVEQNALVVISAQWNPVPSESRTDGVDVLVENGRFDNPTRQRFRWNPDGSEVTFVYVVPRTGQLTILTPRHEELNAPTYIGAPIESIAPWSERNGTEVTYRENHRSIRVRVYRQASAQGATTLQRTRWRVDDTGDWFERNSDGRWTEHRHNGVMVHFTETDRGVDFIELFDPDRQMAFRLYASGARWRVGNGEWNQWDHSGSWVE